MTDFVTDSTAPAMSFVPRGLVEQIQMSARCLFEWRDAHPKLVSVLLDVLALWPFPKPFVVTCIGRTAAEDNALKASGVHVGKPYRALDFRISHLGPDYQERADALAERINMLWAYDLARPTMRVLFTAPHGTGPHGHIQVHQQTRPRAKRLDT